MTKGHKHHLFDNIITITIYSTPTNTPRGNRRRGLNSKEEEVRGIKQNTRAQRRELIFSDKVNRSHDPKLLDSHVRKDSVLLSSN